MDKFREECNKWNNLSELIFELTKLVDSSREKEALDLRDRILNDLEKNYSEPLWNYLNLEEETGCSLDVIVRAVRDGIYGFHKIYDGARTEAIEVFEHFEVSFDGYSLWNETNYEYNYDEIFKISPILNEINLSDYKKTWWLKEDKSE